MTKHLTALLTKLKLIYIFVIPDIRAQEQTRFKKTYLVMIYERLRSYPHLPYQLANNGINCYDTKLSKYQQIL